MLKEILELNTHTFSLHAGTFPEVYGQLDDACVKLVATGFYMKERIFAQGPDPYLGQMLCDVNEWIVKAAGQYLMREYDAGTALLRMACEHARDLCVLARFPEHFDLWVDGHGRDANFNRAQQSKYRQTFRFDLTSRNGSQVFELYNMYCTYGVHGAGLVTQSSRNQPIGKSVRRLNDVAVALISVPLLCLDGLEPWFKSNASTVEQRVGMSLDEVLADLNVRLLQSSAAAGGCAKALRSISTSDGI